MTETVLGLDAWLVWLIAGVVLGAMEIAIPGFFLMWLGAAALLTGLVTWIFPIGFGAQMVVFALLSLALVAAARQWIMRNPITSQDPDLNDRGARMVGQVVTVVDPIENGVGRVTLGDSVWNAKGSNAAVGTKLRVIGLDSGAVIVEPV
jgi:inner membrane protein